MENTFISREEALADPSRVNDLIAQLTGSQDIPLVPSAPGDLINLPSGGNAQVKELTGVDEEALSRTMSSNSTFHFMDTLLNRGVTHIQGMPATPESVANLLLGDRDELLIQIRVATYGPDFEFEGWTCPHCGIQSDLRFSLADSIERVALESNEYGEPGFEIELRRGAKALVRFPTGVDQKACDNKNWTPTERNSEMLRRCVKTITRPDGSSIHVQAFPGAIAEMNIPDRHKIVEAINDRQPGPRYNVISFVHEECQKEVRLALSMVDLFRDLLLGF